MLTPLGHDWEVDPDEWWRTLEINVRGPFLCTHLLLPRMLTRHQGRIVNVSSGAAHSFEPSIFPYGIAYCTAKAALARITDLLATAVKESWISVFALSPGGPTAMIETLATSASVPEHMNVIFRKALGEPSSQTQASVQILLFLVSGQADRLTGRHLSYTDSIDDLLHRTEEILRDDLYTLRLRV